MTRPLLVLAAAAATLGVALFVLLREDPSAGPPVRPEAPAGPGVPAAAADLVRAGAQSAAAGVVAASDAPAAAAARSLPSPALPPAPGPTEGQPEMWFAPEHKVIQAATARIFRPDGTVEVRQIRVEATPVFTRAGLARIDPEHGVQPVVPETPTQPTPPAAGGD